MQIAIGCDHAGFPLKDEVTRVVLQMGHEVIDVGTFDTNPVDYPDYAKKVADAVLGGRAERGILICGSGVGACVAANKIKGIFAGLCHDVYSAHQSVEHDDVNVLCIGARVIGPEPAKEIVQAFLNAQFSQGERHIRRTNKIREFENNFCKNEER
ncbi:MAG TPA: ribose 5-phosphate isomerase B [Bellilinea sp.]|mgnify:CR=1 FL=1|nr:ribose 5-phosphate isomerase B [Bellilinea sp.]